MKAKRWIFLVTATFGVAVFLLLDGPLAVYQIAARERRVHHEAPFPTDGWRSDPSIVRKAEEITAIVLERTGCFGSCPVYVLRLERSRRATYEGRAFVARIGTFEGEVYGFDQLAYFTAARLLDLRESYESPITCQSTTIVTIEFNDGSKSISDYADSAPIDFQIFCSAVEGVSSYIEWRRKEANQPIEPTSTSVTDRADARSAPAAPVAHQ